MCISNFINESVFKSFPNLESERLIYRAFNINDAQTVFEIKSDEMVMKHMDSKWHSNIKDSIKTIKNYNELFKKKKGINWAIVDKSNKAVIGYFGFWRLCQDNSRGEIGYSLKPAFWGKGFMKETMTCLIHFGFKKLNLHSIEANINPSNINSEKLLLKFGFKKEAHFRENYFYNGKFLDSIIYSLLESDIK